MSISLTIYDVFANLVPGLLYLYVINEALNAFHQRAIDINQLDKAYNLILVLATAYILGHLFNSFTHNWWYKLFFRKPTNAAALNRVKEQFAGNMVNFKRTDSGPLMGLIRQHIPETAHSIQIFRANALMCRNISLGLALFGILQFVMVVYEPVAWENHLLMAGLAIGLSALALIKANQDRQYFYEGVFTAALNYGSCLEEVLETCRKLTAKEDLHPLSSLKKKGEEEKKSGRRG